jgi:hypothetical protein
MVFEVQAGALDISLQRAVDHFQSLFVPAGPLCDLGGWYTGIEPG